MNSFVYVAFIAYSSLLINAFPTEHEEPSSSTSIFGFSPFQGIEGITNSVTDNLRDAARTTKTISDFVINGDTSRTRGLWSWLSSCFGGSKKKSATPPPRSQSQSFGASASTLSQPKKANRDDVILTISTTKDFNEKVIKSQTPFLVMYSFTGCGACNTVSPTIEEYVVSLNGKILYAKINTDNVNVPDKNNLSAYPTIQVFHNGQSSARYGPRDTQNNYKTVIQPYIS